MLSFQQLILTLQTYWDAQGCALLQPYDMEVGAGTSHTATFLRALGPEPWKAAYVQPSRRPKDGRYGENPNRLQHYYQYQVVLKPAPANILDLYLGSLEALGLRPEEERRALRRRRLGEPDARLLGPGLGGVAQRHGGHAVHLLPAGRRHRCRPITGEITYGLERLAMYIQGVESIFDLQWAPGITYRDVYHQNEVEQSAYNFEHSNVEFLLRAFGEHEQQAQHLMQQQLALPAYEQVLKAAHTFQPARRARRDQRDRTPAYIGRIRNLARAVAKSYLTAARG